MFMIRKFSIIACRDGIQMFRKWLKQIDNGYAQPVSDMSLNFTQQSNARFAFCKAHNLLTMSFNHYGVHFPINDTLTLVDNFWSLFYAHTIWQLAATIIAAIAFATFLLRM
jgi:hypothetical protein